VLSQSETRQLRERAELARVWAAQLVCETRELRATAQAIRENLRANLDKIAEHRVNPASPLWASRV